MSDEKNLGDLVMQMVNGTPEERRAAYAELMEKKPWEELLIESLKSNHPPRGVPDPLVSLLEGQIESGKTIDIDVYAAERERLHGEPNFFDNFFVPTFHTMCNIVRGWFK